YDLDSDPIDVKPWTQLENVKTYYHFFKEHEQEFT
ncbi:MAG: AAA family ATPase, partial [Clostridia bacterium]|nr:AAA family ATPase [Clostridia bacterium]